SADPVALIKRCGRDLIWSWLRAKIRVLRFDFLNGLRIRLFLRIQLVNWRIRPVYLWRTCSPVVLLTLVSGSWTRRLVSGFSFIRRVALFVPLLYLFPAGVRVTWLFAGNLRRGVRFVGGFAGLRSFLASLCLRVLRGGGLLLWRRSRFVSRVRPCRLRLLFLWLLLLFVLLGDHARGHRERTANQYSYNFFHVTLSSGF